MVTNIFVEKTHEGHTFMETCNINICGLFFFFGHSQKN